MNSFTIHDTRLLLLHNADMYAKMNANSEECSISIMKFLLTTTYQAGDDQEIFNILKLLINNGYNINETDKNGISLLMFANVHSQFDSKYPLSYNIIKFLIEKGANMKIRDNKGRTVLMWASGSTNSQLDKESDIPIIEEKYQFAQFNYELIKYLVNNGEDIYAKDNKGYTSLDYFKQTEENSKHWGQFNTVGKSKTYIEQCNAIEELLKIK